MTFIYLVTIPLLAWWLKSNNGYLETATAFLVAIFIVGVLKYIYEEVTDSGG